MRLPENCDACIVGGGPAGLSSAIALAQEGLRCAVFDCATPPIDKACGEGLLPDSIAALSSLGITLPPDAGFAFRGIRFTDGISSVTADFPHRMGLGLRRTVLHRMLVARAEALSIRLYWGTRKIHFIQGGLSIDGEPVRAPYVIAADGQNSSLRREAKLEPPRAASIRYGFRQHYRVRPWSPYMELHWGRRNQIYITPVSTDEIAVALISRDPARRLKGALAEFPEIRERLEGAVPTTSEKGALSVSRRLSNVVKPGLALIGDASGSVDALTGEGIGLSFRQSLALAKALQSGGLATYDKAHPRLCSRPRTMAALMLLLDRYPGLQRRALASLAARPRMFESLLSIHVGEGAFTDLFSWEALNFCRSFLAA